MATAPRRRIGRRRRLEEEGQDGEPEALELGDDSLSEGSIDTDDNEDDAASDAGNINGTSPAVASSTNSKNIVGNGSARSARSRQPAGAKGKDGTSLNDTQLMMEGLSVGDDATGHAPSQERTDNQPSADAAASTAPAQSRSASKGPLVVSSSSANRQQAEPVGEHRRKEHEEYKRRRDEDPAFVPNRGAFFMHDHRHAGPAANGFRPFGRGRGGRGGRGGIGGPFAPVNQFNPPSDPLTSGQWSHDMHDTMVDPSSPRHNNNRTFSNGEGPPNGNGVIPTRPPNRAPINRTMSTERLLGNVMIRVSIPVIEKGPLVLSRPVKQYTKLPDHRPPLRRDKPVRISLPGFAPKYVFPAVDRSFIFIPRAMRPNQQRTRGKPRSTLGSMGGYSRRTSIYGGSYYGSAYSPSIALSRRSSLAPDPRDFMFSPTGSVVSRAPQMPVENSRPVVRLPPSVGPPQTYPGPDMVVPANQPMFNNEASITDLPVPQTHPLPQKPPTLESQSQPLTMHQPRPQKTVSVADIETPDLGQQPFQQAFHQQVPVQMANGLGPDGHSRQPSYHSTGTPLSQIPERAIHAAPFQPNTFSQPPQAQPQQQSGYYNQGYGMMPPQPSYYYPPYANGNMGTPGTAGPYMPPSQQMPPGQMYQPGEQQTAQGPGQQAGSASMVAQEVNGMVYYYDATQMSGMAPYPNYQAPTQGYNPGVPAMGNMMAPSSDGYYYPPNMGYYPSQ